MTIHIIGCGETASLWDGKGYSLGINDCWKFGHKTNALVISNRPGKFPQDRLETIRRSRPERFFSPLNSWKHYFTNWEEIKLRSWDGHLYKDTIIHTDTSASIAMDLARKLGANEIVIWGIDMVTHSTYNQHNPQTRTEVTRLRSIIDAFKGVGVNVYVGAEGSELGKFLRVWGQ